MKQYEVMYFGSDNIVRTKTVEVDNAIEARKTVTKEEGTFIKARQLGLHRKAVTFTAVFLFKDSNGYYYSEPHDMELGGYAESSKGVVNACHKAALEEYPDALTVYIDNIKDKE